MTTPVIAAYRVILFMIGLLDLTAMVFSDPHRLPPRCIVPQVPGQLIRSPSRLRWACPVSRARRHGGMRVVAVATAARPRSAADGARGAGERAGWPGQRVRPARPGR